METANFRVCPAASQGEAAKAIEGASHGSLRGSTASGSLQNQCASRARHYFPVETSMSDQAESRVLTCY